MAAVLFVLWVGGTRVLVPRAKGIDLVTADRDASPQGEKLNLAIPSPSPTVTLTWTALGGPPGGLGYDIRYSFSDPNTWYVTDNFAGVHKSTDNGHTWFPSNAGIPKQSGPSGDWRPIFSLTVDPHNPQIVWAGTDVTGHIYRSTDAGTSWQERDNGVVKQYDTLSFRGFTVDPTSSDIVYAMAEMTRVDLGGKSVWSNGVGGLVYKTTNGGQNWVKIWDGGMPSSLARYLWIDPRDPANRDDDILFVSTGIFDRGAAGQGNPNTDVDPWVGLGILRSFDSGHTWEILGTSRGLEGLYVGSLFMHPFNPRILLAAVGHEMGPAQTAQLIAAGHSPAGVYRTNDGGDTWVQVFEPPVERVSEQFSSVEICTCNPNIAYAGSSRAILRSSDGGVHWEVMSGGCVPWGAPGVRAGWPIDLQCDPRDPDRLFANNYQGGNFLSEDGGRTWQNASQGYTGGQMYSLAVDPADPARVFAQGRSGVWRSTGGTAWVGLFHPPQESPCPMIEMKVVVLDPARPNRLLASDVDCDYILESLDGGESWHGHPLPPGLVGDVGVLVLAPSQPATIYGGIVDPNYGYTDSAWPRNPAGFGAVVSRDGGQTWQRAVDTNLEGYAVPSLAAHPHDPQVVYAAATSGGLLKSTDGGGHWTRLTIADVPTGEDVRCVAIDPADPQHMLAGVRLWGIYSSDNGGQTWQWSGTGLEANSQCLNLLFDPQDVRVVYAADYASGVYRSEDGGRTWQLLIEGLENRGAVSVALTSDSQHLYLATNGNGVYRLDLNGQPPVTMKHIYLPLIVKRLSF